MKPTWTHFVILNDGRPGVAYRYSSKHWVADGPGFYIDDLNTSDFSYMQEIPK